MDPSDSPLAAIVAALVAAIVAVGTYFLGARRDRSQRLREERRDVYADQLAKATVVEQLLHRVLNRRLAPIPADLLTQIDTANVAHAEAHARVHVLGTREVVARVDTLGARINSTYKLCIATPTDWPTAKAEMVRLQEARRALVDQIRSQLW